MEHSLEGSAPLRHYIDLTQKKIFVFFIAHFILVNVPKHMT